MAVPGADDMAALEDAGEDARDMAAMQIQALAPGGCGHMVAGASLFSGDLFHRDEVGSGR